MSVAAQYVGVVSFLVQQLTVTYTSATGEDAADMLLSISLPAAHVIPRPGCLPSGQQQ